MSRAALAPARAAFRVPPVRRRAQGKWSTPIACRLLKRPLKVDHQGMDPPSEQLIRDYLNRLSLAAKARLEPRDRQALLDDTRARIDSETGSPTNPTPAPPTPILPPLPAPTAVPHNT